MSRRPRGPAAPELVFFDTNVLVYAHDADAPQKRDLARALLLEHLAAGTFCTSTQVMAEYFSVVTTKGSVPLEPAAAGWLAEQLPADAVVAPAVGSLRSAARLSASLGLSIWDALIVQAALDCGAGVILTEDARLLRVLAASAVDHLRAENPFVAPAGAPGD
jgi:predicted nucleic acid-binding protein